VRKILWLLLPLLGACATLPKPELAQSLFPAGNYQHQIDITVNDTRQAYQFSGVAGVSDSGVKIYMMGPMNVTAVKIQENFAEGKVEIENYFEPLKPYETYIRRFYPVIRSLLLFPKEKQQWGELAVSERNSDGSIKKFSGPYGMEIEIREYRNHHPTKLDFRHDRFRAQLKEITI
jgi:hypothetical protein